MAAFALTTQISGPEVAARPWRLPLAGESLGVKAPDRTDYADYMEKEIWEPDVFSRAMEISSIPLIGFSLQKYREGASAVLFRKILSCCQLCRISRRGSTDVSSHPKACTELEMTALAYSLSTPSI
jgi:hypothetical protein